MLEGLYPQLEIPSVYGFDFRKAYAEGVRGLIFDIDNTLVPHDAPADARAEGLVRNLKDMGFCLTIVSNNSEERVVTFTERMGIPYVCRAHKPSPAGYLAACQKMDLVPEQVLFFGDQIFTDIWGANRAGVKSVLVAPLDPDTDLFQIRLKRLLEKPVLWAFHRRQRRQAS